MSDARELDAFLLEAMREVDALTPSVPPIAPPQQSLPRSRVAIGHRERFARLGLFIDEPACEWICPDGSRVSFAAVDLHGYTVLSSHLAPAHQETDGK